MATSYAQLYFGKAIDDIDAEDIMNFFSEERPESITLEFKSFAQREGDIKLKEKGVIRTVCAFLNSEGGLLIWGAPEGTINQQGEKVFVGELSPVTKYYSKDSFISKLITRIHDPYNGIRFEDIKVGDDQYVYLIDVPESEIKPHQFEDRYWIRHDGQTQIAPHYLVRALFNQIKRPILSAKFSSITHRIEKGYRGSPRPFDEVVITMQGNFVNLTHSVNETNVFAIYHTDRGEFDSGTLPRYYRDQITRDFSGSILAYGLHLPFSIDLHLILSHSSTNTIVNVQITLGGKLSAPTIIKKKFRIFQYTQSGEGLKVELHDESD